MRLFLPAAAILSLTACGDFPADGGEAERMIAPILTSAEAFDDDTFAQPQVARVTHVSLDLDLDFAARDISGKATLDIAAADGAQEIVLDSNGLEIVSVTDAEGAPLEWELGETVEGKGEPLTIAMGDARRITVTYSAGPEAEALQWLEPSQTAGGEHPYLFSQGQSINNRTWIPTQEIGRASCRGRV